MTFSSDPRRSDDTHELPDQVEDAVRTINEFRVEHAERATVSERAIERVTFALGRPTFIALIIAFVAIWVATNEFGPLLRLPRFDPPPFYWLQGLVSLTALCMTALILTTQRRLDRLAEDRAQLTLQIAIVGEQKSAKLIALLEELRSDHPEMPNRHDPEAQAMSASANPKSVLQAIRETHAGAQSSVDDCAPPRTT